MDHKGTVRLETPRLILRQFAPEDLQPMYENCWRYKSVTQWTSYASMDRLEDVQQKADMFTEGWLRYDDPKRYSWAIVEKTSGQVIGRMFGMHPDDRTQQVELAYELGPHWWNRGLMTEAVQAVLAFFFEQVGLNRVFAYHAAQNPASGRVLQKCGMVYEGTLRQASRCNWGIIDMVCYGMLAPGYKNKAAEN